MAILIVSFVSDATVPWIIPIKSIQQVLLSFRRLGRASKISFLINIL